LDGRKILPGKIAVAFFWNLLIPVIVFSHTKCGKISTEKFYFYLIHHHNNGANGEVSEPRFFVFEKSVRRHYCCGVRNIQILKI
jgi:hypothetical protein